MGVKKQAVRCTSLFQSNCFAVTINRTSGRLATQVTRVSWFSADPVRGDKSSTETMRVPVT